MKNKIFILIFLMIVFNIVFFSWIFSDNENTKVESPIKKISFIDNGEELLSLEVEKGTIIERPADPQRDGYVFSHWATHQYSVDGSEVFDFNVPISESYTLFAHYEQLPKEPELSINKLCRENYDKIENGMSEEEVIELLGNPHSKSETEMQGYGESTLYMYNVSTLTSCQIYFHNGKVVMKNWTEL